MLKNYIGDVHRSHIALFANLLYSDCMSKKPFILVTNDDGIFASGIKELWSSLSNFADLTIVAPLNEKSGAAISASMTTPLFVRKVAWEKEGRAWSVNGTPVDCVKLALHSILDKVPDLIVSGINRGTNSGRNFLYSGTVGGVIEGVLHNIPGIAFSYEEYENPEFSLFEKYIPLIVQYFIRNPLPMDTFLNVTFPQKVPKGLKMARQGISFCTENIQKGLHPDGEHYFWLGGKWRHLEERSDSDIALLKEGYITAVPIRIDEFTHREILEKHKDQFENFFKASF